MKKKLLNLSVFNGSQYGLSDLLMYAFFIDNGVILQTDGSFLCSFWYHGYDLETSSEEELAIVSSKVNNALNLLGNGWVYHIDIIRHLSHGYTKVDDNCFYHDVLNQIDEERRSIYQNESVHFENKYAISFTFKPKMELKTKFSSLFYTINDDIDYYYHLKQFLTKVNEVESLLVDDLNLSRMNSQQLASYLSWCITGEYTTIKLPINYGTYLKNLLASKDLVNASNFKIGDKYLKIISISGFPSESYPGILDKLNYLEFEYRWTTRFIPVGQYEGNKLIDRIANLWFQKRISAMDTIKLSLAIDSNIKINQHSEANYNDAEAARFVSESGEVKFGMYTATFTIMDNDPLVVEQHAQQIQSVLRALGFQNQIERYHALEAFLGSLPGFSYANVRKWLIHSLNLSDLMPTTAIWSGLEYNPCKLYKDNNPPLFYAKTTGNTPLRLSLHVEDNGHTLIIGPTGSGKSTLLNFLVSQHFRYKDARVFLFDKNRSSLPLCYAIDGNFFDIGETGNSTYFQPLANLETDLDLEFAVNFIEDLCLLNNMTEFNYQNRNAVFKALKLMQTDTIKSRRTISYLRHLIQDYDKAIANILNLYSQETNSYDKSQIGFMNKVFDDNKDVLNINNGTLNVFEMGNLMNQGDKVLIPALKYLIHSISKQLDDAKPTLIVFDECFLFIKHDLFRQKIIEWVKTVRKFNVAIIFATQEINDFIQYEDLRSSLLTNCATKIFLPNKKAMNSELKDSYISFGLNEKQIGLIANGVRGDYFYTSELGTRKFNLDLRHNQLTYALVAKNSQQDIKTAIELKSKFKNDYLSYWFKYCNTIGSK